MGDFVKLNTAPPVFVDATPPQGLPGEFDAAHVNALWNAAADLRTHTAGWFNVKTYGAIGNGIADDTAAIQSAIDAAATASGTVLFPAGTYVVSRAGTNQWALTNTGATSLRLVGQAGAKLTMASDISTTQIALGYFFGVQKMEVTGLDISVTITGNPATRVNAYIFNFSPNGSTPCNDVWIHGNTFAITHALGSSEIRALFGTYFYGGEQNGPTWAQSRFSFTDNFIRDSEGRGVETWNAEKVIVSRNRFANMAPVRSATVIRMIGSVRHVQVADNYVELAASANSATSYGIVWGSGSTTEVTWTPTKSDLGTFINNTIIVKGGDGTNPDIGVYCQGGQRASFIGNTIVQNNNISFSGTGFRFDADPNAGSNNDIALIGNRISGWNTWGVFENDAGSARIQLVHNIFGGPSAAALAGQDKDFTNPDGTLDVSGANWNSLKAAWTYGAAKYRRLDGTASPQNTVVGSPGDFYADTTNGDLYWKGSGAATSSGWLKQASTLGAGTTVTAGSTIPVTKDPVIVYSVNSAGPVTASATTAIASGSFVGQLMYLQGTSDTNTVTIPHNANTRLDAASSITLKQFDAILFHWNGGAWIELMRKHAGSVAIPSGGSTTIGAGVGSVKMSTANAANNAAWIPITYAGTTYFVPAWTTNAP
jgi:hypothetical protein